MPASKWATHLAHVSGIPLSEWEAHSDEVPARIAANPSQCVNLASHRPRWLQDASVTHLRMTDMDVPLPDSVQCLEAFCPAEIPAHVLALPKLRSLSLMSHPNRPIPHNLKAMTGLETLALHGTNLAAEDVGFLAALPSLTSFRCVSTRRSTEFFSEVPLVVTGLKCLVLPIVDRLPESLSSLTNLEALSVMKVENAPLVQGAQAIRGLKPPDCNGSREDCLVLSRMPHLEYLRLDYAVDDLSGLRGIRVLYAPLTEEGIASASKLPFLEDLTLSGGKPPVVTRLAPLASAPSLKRLSIRMVSFFVTDVMLITSLESLHFCTYRELELPPTLGQLVRLTTLSSDFPLGLPETISNLTDLRELTGCAKRLPASLTHCTRLEVLSLTMRGAETVMREKLGCLPHMKILTLHEGVKSLPTNMAGLTNLVELKVHSCFDLTELPASLGCLPALEILVLSDCNLWSLPDSICDLRALRVLKLSGLRRLRHLPAALGNLSSLEQLRLRDVGLDELPESLGSLSSLRSLHVLTCTGLSKLPDSLGDLSRLEVLHIRNVGSTKLPDSFQDLSQLKDLMMASHVDVTYVGHLTRLRSLTLADITAWPEGISEMRELETCEVGCGEPLPTEFLLLPRLVSLSVNVPDMGDSTSESSFTEDDSYPSDADDYGTDDSL